MTYYTSVRLVDSKPKKVIVDETGKVVNRSPCNDELKKLEKFPEKDGRSKPRGDYIAKTVCYEYIEYYNPKNKEFQEEAKRLELTGYQLTAKYQKEGKFLEKKIYEHKKQYTKEQLLWYLVQFYEKYGRPPTQIDFTNNPEYPNYQNYRIYFGSWSAALRLVGLDTESMVKKGVIKTQNQKARFTEMIIRDHFEKHPTDLAGKNCKSPYDGICPNGLYYDVKSSKLHKERDCYTFVTNNKYKEEIEIYYLLGFNKDWTKLDYGWRIPGEIVESDNFIVGLNPSYKFDIEDIEKYNITDKLREVLEKYEFFSKIKET